MNGNDTKKPEKSKAFRQNTLLPLLVILAFGLAAMGATGAGAQETQDDVPGEISFSPRSGPVGTYVWVNGTGFESGTQVKFGGIPVAFDTHGATQYGFIVPEQPESGYQISVVTPDGEVGACCFTVTATANGSTPDVPDVQDPADEATQSCSKSGKNVQCNVLGRIEMDSQRNIKGEPVELKATVTLDTNFADRDARFILFSVRNVTDYMDSPVVIKLNGFSTPAGDLITTRVEHKTANELNLWVHVLDTPVGVPITLDLLVGSTDRGAYLLETLVMPFDRGYEPIPDAEGKDISLYAYTLLGVNDETKGDFSRSGGPLTRIDTPGFELATAALALVGGAAIVARRRTK